MSSNNSPCLQVYKECKLIKAWGRKALMFKVARGRKTWHQGLRQIWGKATTARHKNSTREISMVLWASLVSPMRSSTNSLSMTQGLLISPDKHGRRRGNPMPPINSWTKFVETTIKGTRIPVPPTTNSTFSANQQLALSKMTRIR